MRTTQLEMHDLIELILKNYDLSMPQLVTRSGLSKSYTYYLRDQNKPVDEYPLGTIRRLAWAVNLSVADLCYRAGIDVLANPVMNQHFEFEHLRLSPLVSMEDVRQDVKLQHAINWGILARQNYYYDADLNIATSALDRALNFAVDAEAHWLATYLRIYLAHFSEMTGKLKRANDLCQEAEQGALAIQRDGRMRNDKDLEWLGKKIHAQTKVRRLWTDYWAKGVSEASILAGEALIKELDDNVPQEIPNVYYFLARCALALERFSDALKFIKQANTNALVLANIRLKKFELFLDVGMNAENQQPMYLWKEDQIIAATADILVSVGEVEKAWEVYATVKDHERPRLYLSFFSWHDPRWQKMLEEKIVSNNEDDYPFGYSTADWDDTVRSSGYVRLQAMTKFDEGQHCLEIGELNAAMKCFESSKKLALDENQEYKKGYVAEDLLLKVEIATSLLKAMQGDKALAVSSLNMIQARVERMNNPPIAAQHKAAFQRIALL